MSNSDFQPGLVSTIIPVFNRPILVKEAIESVLAQTYRPIEVIVVDDGSTDNTLSVLSRLAEQNVELTILTQVNAGPGVARELGRQNARGEFIQYLDSDDLLMVDKFSLQVSVLNDHPSCVVAYGKTEATLIGEPTKGLAMRQTGICFDAMFPAFLRSRWWGTSTPLYRASVLNSVGAWLPLINEEDWEYDCRIASLGGKLAYVDEFVSNARRHDDHLSDQGSKDITKLKHRCMAQQEIYKHARAYMLLDARESEITAEDWSFYSKSVFLLARQCAAAGMADQASVMVELSIAANGRMTIQHRVFCFLVSIVGWCNASKLIKLVGK